MDEILYKIGPIVVLFAIGYLLKLLKILKSTDGDIFLKVVFYISLPALILNSVSKIELSTELAFFPVSSAILISIMFLLTKLTSRFFKFDNQTKGVYITGPMILNIGFALPFIIAFYGDTGLAKMALFDVSNGFLVFTWSYYLSCKYGGSGSGKVFIKKILLSVPLWALMVGLTLNLGHIKINGFFSELFTISGSLTIPLLMIALGAYFSPKIVLFKSLLLAVGIRMGAGFLIGWALCEIIGLSGIDRSIILIGSSVPIGFNTIVFASLEKLNREFAASLVSVSILIGMLLIPLIILYTA
ncbi:MAG: hypothetical protein C0594_13450 [Marinilabiliales bacterium]|nr:MAG: hypothetical protein C0594_13450 [Marinilabiliales bacterium]